MSPTKIPQYRIASIPADGIGIEVVAATIDVIEHFAKTLGTFQDRIHSLSLGIRLLQKGRQIFA
jgi:isocitrate/isopropylmalate dehydrogenase